VNPSARIILVEDEPALREMIRLNLEAEGYEVNTADTGPKALELIASRHADLIILDVMLPEIDGFQLCTMIRLDGIRTPIMFLTAKDAAPDRVRGLRTGADDYMAKPFNLEELLLRIEKLIQRSKPESHTFPDTMTFGANKIDLRAHLATDFRGNQIHLSKKEVQLLRLFQLRKNEVISREEILQTVWGYDVYPTTRTIDNFILSFRKNFEPDIRNPQYFRSVRGIGYLFSSD
jgi:two-component system, OmpR family, alkaline phosphatase synthesis response regulator PhoP